MNALDPFRLVRKFQWLVIPHGVESSSSGTLRLRLTVRVIPQLFAGDFTRTKPQLRHLRGGERDPAVKAVLDWPEFAAGIRRIGIGFAGDDRSQLRGEPRVVEVPERNDVLRRLGATRKLASKLWQAMFTAELAVDAMPDVGSFEAQEWNSSQRMLLPEPLPHARGAQLLRHAIGRLHIAGLAKVAGRGRTLQPPPGFRSAVVEVNAAPREEGPLRELAQLFTSLTLPQTDNVYTKMEQQGSGQSKEFKEAVRSDLDRVLALKLPFNGGGHDSLVKKISAWNLPGVARYLLNERDYQLGDFFLERCLATAPDLIQAQQSKSGVSSTAVQDDEIDPPEFHKDLARVATHQWMMDVLGIAFDVVIDDPPALDGNIGLFVETIDYGTESFKPDSKPHVMTGAPGWLPIEASKTTRQLAGCMRVADPAVEPKEALFTLEQVDIDSALEKILTTVHTEASQIDAGVAADKRATSLSTLRTAGLSLLKRNNDHDLADQARHTQTRRNALLTGQTIKYYAEDLLIGYRPDICTLEIDERSGSCRRNWKSLTGRTLVRLRVDAAEFADEFATLPQDEAFITPNARLLDANARTEDSKRILAFEEMFCWQGWSLAAPQVEAARQSPRTQRNVPAIEYRARGLPLQRFGWGYRVGLRAVYLDGRSLSLAEAAQVYSTHWSEVTLGTAQVGNDVRANDPFYTPFLRYEAIQPATAKLPRSSREVRPERMLVSSDAYGAVLEGRTERTLVPPRVDLENAIRAGAFDTRDARLRPPPSGDVPDPWAKRLVLGFYRAADGKLLQLEHFEYYDNDEHRWPRHRTLTLRLHAVTDQVLPVHDFEIAWDQDTIDVRLAPGAALEIRHWHEIDARQLSASGVVEAMARALLNAQASDLAALDLSACTGFCDMRDQLIARLSRWHEKFPYDLRPLLAAGRPAREVNLVSFSMLNPANTIALVHAVPVPARAPKFSQATHLGESLVALVPMSESEVARRFEFAGRVRGQTVGEFVGDIEIHRASTERIDCFGEWTEVIDKVEFEGPVKERQSREMFRVEGIRGMLPSVPTLVATGPAADDVIPSTPGGTSDLPPDNELLMLDPSRPKIGRTSNTDFGAARPHFDFGDAKARLIHFRVQATSRYAADFPKVKKHYRDSIPGESRWLQATLPPEPPRVAFIVPLFDSETSADRGTVRKRRSGGWFRIWLERPWYSSGVGELMALVCWPQNLFRARGGAADFLVDKLKRAWGSLRDQAPANPEIWPVDRLARLYTAWGLDPIWSQPKARLTFIPPGAFANRLLPDLPNPVLPSQFMGLPNSVKELLGVSLALYEPIFDAQEQRWYADVHITPDAQAYFPFVRLGLARYQPNAICGCELSEIVASELVQLAPDRSATVTATHGKGRSHRVRVDIHGQGNAGPADPESTGTRSLMLVRFEEAAGRAPRGRPRTWIPKQIQGGEEQLELTFDPAARAWSGQTLLDLERDREYSVYIEEREGLVADATPHSTDTRAARAAMRVIYVDRIPLPTGG